MQHHARVVSSDRRIRELSGQMKAIFDREKPISRLSGLRLHGSLELGSTLGRPNYTVAILSIPSELVGAIVPRT